MTTQTPKQQAIFPDLPRDLKIINEEGEMTSTWHLYFEQLTSALQAILKPEGSVMPQVTAANIALLTGTLSVANIVYDSTNNLFKGNVLVGSVPTWKTFTTS